jgi:hypothetical protein
MFIVVFTAIYFHVMDLIDNNFFRFISLGGFLVVVACAVYFVGLPKFENSSTQEVSEREKNEEK